MSTIVSKDELTVRNLVRIIAKEFVVSKIHVNPKTGEPGECRAKVRCRFGADTPHHGTVEEALDYYAQQQELNEIPQSATKISYAAKILKELSKIESLLVQNMNKSKNLKNGSKNQTKLLKERIDLKKKKDELRFILSNQLSWEDTDFPAYDAEEIIEFTIIQENFANENNSSRQGYSISFDNCSYEQRQIYDYLDRASELWIKRLSSAEIKALVIYEGNSSEYSRVVNSPDELTKHNKSYIKNLHSALAKAPKTDKNIRLFSGISTFKTDKILDEASSKTVNFEGLQSFSLNPAMVNEFMSNKPNCKKVAVEIEVKYLASMSILSESKHEMEFLVLPGKYEVKQSLKNVSYHWQDEVGFEEDETSDYTFELSSSKEE